MYRNSRSLLQIYLIFDDNIAYSRGDFEVLPVWRIGAWSIHLLGFKNLTGVATLPNNIVGKMFIATKWLEMLALRGYDYSGESIEMICFLALTRVKEMILYFEC